MEKRPPGHLISEDRYGGGPHLIALTQESEVTADHRHLRPLRMPVQRPVRCVGRLAPYAVSAPRLKKVVRQLV